MDIKSLQPVDTTLQTDLTRLNNKNKTNTEKSSQSVNYTDAETRQALDRATGLLQTIITNKLSDKVIRKMPTDEYLHLLSLLDEIINGSIDKHV